MGERLRRNRNRMKKTFLTILACALLVQVGTAHAQCVDSCAHSVELIRFVDNNNGTISDTCTGLQWEKKTPPGTGGLHDVDNKYLWSADTKWLPNGSVFTVFLYGLNLDQIRFEEHAPIIGCFAKHCDWRLPTYTELLSIVDQRVCVEGTRFNGEPCIDPTFGPTQPNDFQGADVTSYWSATTYANTNSTSVNVDFHSGTIVGGGKNFIPDYARAVRCGDLRFR